MEPRLVKARELKWKISKPCRICGVWIDKDRGSLILDNKNKIYCYVCARKELKLPQELKDYISQRIDTPDIMEKIEKIRTREDKLKKLMFWRRFKDI